MIPNWAEERRDMVELQLRRRGIRDQRVLDAMGAIPREEFVPRELRIVAYQDAPVEIGYGQTISQPFMTALMAQELNLEGHETVLEVGSGCGYAAAVLGALAQRVISVEILEPLVAKARENLRWTGRGHNVTIVAGDGCWGFAPDAPYDAISVAAAAPEIPPSLIDQLKDTGRLVIPVGSRSDQELLLVTKRAGCVESQVSTSCRFVPLRGGEGWN